MSITRKRLLSRVSAPAAEPVSLAEAKLFLRVDHANDDLLISDLIVSARLSAEQFLKSSLISQTWKMVLGDFIEGNVGLAMGPVNSITSITVINRDASTQVISSSAYCLNAAHDSVLLCDIICGHAIEIVYAAGFGDSSQVPKPIKMGILNHIAAMYDERGQWDLMGIPDSAKAQYSSFRKIML